MSAEPPSGAISCIEGDITAIAVDAIVNAANESLRGGGGVDGAIHRAAGSGLLRECVARYPEGCPTGAARITSGHRLPARFVVHTPGPIWRGGRSREAELLTACHRAAVRIAAEHGCRTIAFPAISCGVYGYPADRAARVAIPAVRDALVEHPTIERATFVLFDRAMLDVFAAALAEATR